MAHINIFQNTRETKRIGIKMLDIEQIDEVKEKDARDSNKSGIIHFLSSNVAEFYIKEIELSRFFFSNENIKRVFNQNVIFNSDACAAMLKSYYHIVDLCNESHKYYLIYLL